MSWFFREAQHARMYLKYRPVYPKEVFETIYSFLTESSGSASKQWSVAIDVGCGTGQSTLPLCEHFGKVIGVDQSEAQIEEARQDIPEEFKDKVQYLHGDGHDLAFQPDSSVDLITAAQCLHWMDVKKFCVESRRVLRNGGVLAAYGYGIPKVRDTEGHQILMQLYDETYHGYWTGGRKHVLNLYTELYDSFATVFTQSKRVDAFSIENEYSVDQIIGFEKSTSKRREYMKQNYGKPDPLDNLRRRLLSVYGENSDKKRIHVRNPIFILLGTKL